VQVNQQQFAAALARYLDDTVRRERRRAWLARSRSVALLTCILVACQWLDMHSNAASGLERLASQPSSRLAAFACPGLAAVEVQREIVSPVNFPRLSFVNIAWMRQS
jgi:hypothetical protein